MFNSKIDQEIPPRISPGSAKSEDLANQAGMQIGRYSLETGHLDVHLKCGAPQRSGCRFCLGGKRWENSYEITTNHMGVSENVG